MADHDPKPTQPESHSNLVNQISFTVEVADQWNRNAKWPLDERVLRGRWSRDNVVHDVDDERFRGMPDLPGLLIHVEGRGRRAAITDPMANPANREVSDKVSKIIANAQMGSMGPEPDYTVENLSNDDLKSWCYWVRRMLDNKQLRIHRGTVPSMDEISRMPGKVFKENFDTGAGKERLQDVVWKRYKAPRVEERFDRLEKQISFGIEGHDEGY